LNRMTGTVAFPILNKFNKLISTLMSPWVVFTMTAGSEIKNEMKRTDNEPLPSHSRISGLMAMIGIVCNSTTYG
jgi:hypothetical protein